MAAIVVNGINTDMTPKRSIFLSAASGMPRVDSPCAAPALAETTTNKVNYYYLAFDKTADETAEWNFILPDNYDSGTIKARFYWTYDNLGGDVIWRMWGRAFKHGGSLVTELAALGYTNVTDSSILNGKLHITDWTSDITLESSGSYAAGGDFVILAVTRYATSGSDTLNSDAWLIGTELKYGTTQLSD